MMTLPPELQRAQWLALKTAPYAAQAFAAARFIISSDLPLPTTACDARWNVYIHPKALEWEPPKLARALLHEILGHLIRQHHTQTIEALVEMHRSNIAQDLEIESWNWPNPLNFEIKDSCTPAAFNLPPGKLWKWYYDNLPITKIKKQCDCGSGASGPQRNYEVSGGLSPAHVNVIVKATAEAIKSHAGKIPAGLLVWADAEIKPPVVDWKLKLRSYLSHTCARGHIERNGRLYERSSGMLARKWEKPQPRAALLIDTSRSMFNAGSRVLSEATAILAQLSELDVYWCDTALHSQLKVRRASQLQPIGGGGTIIQPLIDAYESGRYQVGILLTDGECTFPSSTPPNLCTIIIGNTPCPWPVIRILP